MDEDGLAEAAEQACVRAGRFLAQHQREGIDVRAKGAFHDLLTELDAEAERLIRAELLARYPGSVVVGEELGTQRGAGSPAAGGDIRWYVDPIDGTYNFARGFPAFAVSVGARVGLDFVAGCVFDPTTAVAYTATRSGGFSVAGRRHSARRGPVSDGPPLMLTDIPGHEARLDPHQTGFLADLLETMDVRRVGSSAMALAHVAAGRADLAANANVFAWDTAAGRVLVTAAGGGFLPLPGEAGTERRSGFVAWAAGHEAAGKQVAEAMREFPALRSGTA
ncbi:fructose-bisphosphatase class II [Streptomyces sp. 3MP-14]|uniref:inositol-phosphate phosphatase n=1 Tax=Streptomyces mimosae TaxID=2586635 RepID=A0A5N6A946_9ACTN|nr:MULTISPECIES: inositol monophosphatase family protein [Streptomyces]KAB8164523.1 fructose-bisphosphatase class II [Streptomyces mimosae]KAB8175439.1 fructose-bisphosphatase class II [Streptomyces sp. 3MP-14]